MLVYNQIEKRRWRLPHPGKMLLIPVKLMQRVTHHPPPSLMTGLMKRKLIGMNNYLNNQMIATMLHYLVGTVSMGDKKIKGHYYAVQRKDGAINELREK